jgi:uncharacterized protein (TIGR03086 family)
MMDWQNLLADSHRALRTVVAGVPADGWQLATPCESWTVTQVLQHATGDQIGFAAAITGGPWPTFDPFAPSGRPEDDPRAFVEGALTLSAVAFSTIADDADAVPNPLPQGPMPAWIVAGACALDAAVHAWDIAVATGQPSPLTPSTARDLMAVAAQIVEPLRAWGAYKPALAPSDDEVLALLHYLGRDGGYPRAGHGAAAA